MVGLTRFGGQPDYAAAAASSWWMVASSHGLLLAGILGAAPLVVEII